jgi:uncharacterized DUF497 family protein
MDDTKAQSNLARHRVSVEAACHVFNDVFAIERPDIVQQGDGVRYVTTGAVHGVLLTAVYTERAGRRRTISVRKATRHEQRDHDRRQAAE